jgi:outer membrane protein assembly factor BamB
MDWAAPLARAGVVYSGTFALNASDGAIRWRVAIETQTEGALAVQVVTDQTLYATTHRGIYAITTQDGQIRWLHQPETGSRVSGAPIVADGLVYAGTNAFFGYPVKGYVFALGGATGAEVWRHPLVGGYCGAVADHARLYVQAGDGTLHVWDRQSGTLRWQHQFAAHVRYPATIANDVLYLTADGAYALKSENGAVLWHEPLQSSRRSSFGPPVIVDGAVYLVRLDEHSRGVLYALDARTGAECWHTPYPAGGVLLAVAQ